jgi:hypothetical protein
MDEIPYRDEIRLRRKIRTDLISSKPPAWISSALADFILAEQGFHLKPLALQAVFSAKFALWRAKFATQAKLPAGS